MTIEYPDSTGQAGDGPTRLIALWVCEQCRRAAWHYPQTKVVHCCGKRSRRATDEETAAGRAAIDPRWATLARRT